MSSSSKTASSADQTTNDQRQIVDENGVAVGQNSTVTSASGKAIAVGAESIVTINQVPDEAIELAGDVVHSLQELALDKTETDDGDLVRVAESIFKFAIPAGLLIFMLAR